MRVVVRKVILVFFIFNLTITCSGCWNYREINEMAIVAGIAIDKKHGSNSYLTTIEIIRAEHSTSGGSIKPKVYEGSGETVFEAIRDLIPKLGRKAFWSHAKVAIISKEIAENDIAPVLDWLYRDQELRRNIYLFVSRESTAAEILSSNPELDNTVSYNLTSTIKNQKGSNRYPKVELGDVVQNFSKEEKSMLLPAIRHDPDNPSQSEIWGSAVLKGKKVVGYLSGDDTFNALWIQNKLKTGVFVVQNLTKPGDRVTFEIFNNSTRTKAYKSDKSMELVVEVNPDVSFAEVMGDIQFSKGQELKNIKEKLDKEISDRLSRTINKVKEEDKADVFNFSNKARIYEPKFYRKVAASWGEEFSSLPVVVKVDTHIRGSAVAAKTIIGGD